MKNQDSNQTVLDTLKHYRKDLSDRLWYALPYKVRDYYYDMHDWLFPKNKWASKIIPNHWTDKTHLIPEFLYAAVIDFVENERALELFEWDKKDKGKIEKIYNWAKFERFAFLKDIEDSYPSIGINDIETMFNSNEYDVASSKELYAKTKKLKAQFEKIETQHLTWIVQNRSKLWT
jgi:hypothetical protein